MDLQMLVEHMAWADRVAREAIVRLPPDGPQRSRAVRLFAHLAAAERVWLSRLLGETPDVAVWPDLDVDEAAALADVTFARLRDYVAGLSDESRAAEITYSTTTGQSFRSRVGDILVHLALHGAYHRGQLALLARDGGAEPAATDYILYTRGSAAQAGSRARVDRPAVAETPQPGVTVRRLTRLDRALARRLFELLVTVFEGEPRPLSDTYLDRLLGRPDFWAFAACDADEVVGGLTAHTVWMTRAESAELFIYDIAVRPDRQRQGIGRALVAAAREAAAAADIPVLFVPADNEDDHALEFYRAVGGDPAPVTIFTFE